MTELFLVLRWLNVALSVVCLVGMVSLTRLWLEQVFSSRLVGLATAGLVVVVIGGSVESMATGVPGGWRVPMTTVALLWLAYALLVAGVDRRRR